MRKLVYQIDPDEDEARVRAAVTELGAFVSGGPYHHPDNNSCWFCFRGIGSFEIIDQEDAGHDPHCTYLIVWRAFYSR